MSVDPERTASYLIDVAETASALLSSFIDLNVNVVSEETIFERLGYSRRSDGLIVLERLVSSAVIKRDGSLLKLKVDLPSVRRVRDLLLGAALAKAGNTDQSPQLVLTPPSSPCLLSKELEKRGPHTTRIEDTREVFQHLAHEAKARLIVMTPFLDESGAKFLVDIFARTNDNVDRILILRFLSREGKYQNHSEGFDFIKDELDELGVTIYDYAVRRGNSGWLETFHAKVLLADRSLAYIGSANINRYSLENSMEVGVLLSDSMSLRSLTDIMETVVSISTKI